MQTFWRLSCALFSSRPSLGIVFLAAGMVGLSPAAFATPDEEIARAVVAGGAPNISQAHANQFTRAFAAIAMRVPQRELPAYVTAAVKLRPDLAAKIVAATVKVAVKHSEMKRRPLCEMVDRIVRAAVAGNPEALISIARAAAESAPGLRSCIAAAALTAAREQGLDISNESGLTLALVAFATHQPAMDAAQSFGTGTMNPANISDLRESNSANSPEQPPTD